jgi:tetratricopeptide (TPR) repeat protein
MEEGKTSPIEPRKKRAFRGWKVFFLVLAGLFALYVARGFWIEHRIREIQKRNGLGDFYGKSSNWKFTGFLWWVQPPPNQTPSPRAVEGATPGTGVAPQKTASEGKVDRMRPLRDSWAALLARFGFSESRDGLGKVDRRDEMWMGMIKALKSEGHSLPKCPLVFPLLDETGQVTPLGSYLSYLSMVRASYLPESVLGLRDAGTQFQRFHLFDEGDNQWRSTYLKNLPFYFGARDFGEGHYVKTTKGYEVSVRFWGTRPEKTYRQGFDEGTLCKAPEWMAACLLDWMGIHPDAAQTTYLEQTVFKNDEDLRRAASLERLYQTGPHLVLRWDDLMSRNSESPFLIERWMRIRNQRDDQHKEDEILALLEKTPKDTYARKAAAAEFRNNGRYGGVVTVCLEELPRDDDNVEWYLMACDMLEKMGKYKFTIALLEAWAGKHPENPNPYLWLSDTWRFYAWDARGTGWGSTVTKDGYKKMKKRLKESARALEKAIQLAPQDPRPLNYQLLLANGTNGEPGETRALFEKGRAMDPSRESFYTSYLEYLKPKWHGSREEMLDFARQHRDRFPGLIEQAIRETLYIYSEDGETPEMKRDRYNRIAEGVQKDPLWAECERSFLDELSRDPANGATWETFAFWAGLAGREAVVTQHAKELSEKDPELKALYPSVALVLLSQKEKRLVIQEEIDAFEKRPETIQTKWGAYRALAALDPHHWWALNHLAKIALENQALPEAKSAFKAIGEHWVDAVWTKPEFDGAKKQVGF